MKQNKRGISPLIATVILIGATIVIAALLWIFLSKEVKLFSDKQGVKCTAQQMAEIEVVVSKCKSSGIGSDFKTIISIQNAGKTDIAGFRIKADDNPSFASEMDLNPGENKDKTLSGKISKLTLFPIVIKDGKVVTCAEKLVEVTCS